MVIAIESIVTGTVIVAGCAVVGTLAWWLMWWGDFEGIRSAAEFRRDRKKRSPMDADEFYTRFYSGTDLSKEMVIRFRAFEATFWGVDAEMVRPEDDYVRISGDLDAVDFMTAIEKEFAITISDADCEKLDGSFDTLVRYVHSRCNAAA